MVEFGSDLFFFPDDCTTSNVQEGFTIEATEGGTIDELFVDIVYADRPGRTPCGLVVADGGNLGRNSGSRSPMSPPVR